MDGHIGGHFRVQPGIDLESTVIHSHSIQYVSHSFASDGIFGGPSSLPHLHRHGPHHFDGGTVTESIIAEDIIAVSFLKNDTGFFQGTLDRQGSGFQVDRLSVHFNAYGLRLGCKAQEVHAGSQQQRNDDPLIGTLKRL